MSDGNTDHIKLKNELLYLVQKQRARIDRLHHDSEVQVQRYATVKRKDLERRKTVLRRDIHEVQPDLNEVRREWQRLKIGDTEHEGVYQKLSEKYLATSSRVKVLQDAIAGAYQGTGEGKQTVRSTRERLAEVERDKGELRAKIKRAIDCVVIDENMLQTRLHEEQDYNEEVKQMLRAVEAEVAGVDKANDSRQDLEEQIRLGEERLKEMKQRTNDLHNAYAEIRARRREMADEFLAEAGRSMQELTQAQSLLAMKTQAAREVQTKISFLKRSVQPVTQQQAPAPEVWLANKMEVMDRMLQDLAPIKDQYQVRPEDTATLKETTSKCSKAKAELTAIEQRVEGPNQYRRSLIDEVVDMRHLIDEKLKQEDQLQETLDALLARLGEDTGHIREVMDRPGFDDYVSSDSELSDEEMLVLDEEGTADVDVITTSLDFHADDPAGADAVQRFGHRQQGPLRSFAEARAAQLSRKRNVGIGERLLPRRKEATPEVALAAYQEQAVNATIEAIANRKHAIQMGTHDPHMEVVEPDANQASRNDAIQTEVNIWKQQQRGGAKYRAEPGVPEALSKVGSPDATSTNAALSIGSREEIASQYLQIMLQGFNCMMFFGGPEGPMGPNPRQVFMTKDLKRLAWRLPQRDGEVFDDESVAINDIVTVVTGHRTGVFKAHRESRTVPLRPHAALSVILQQKTSIDMEVDTEEERTYWHEILTTVSTELKPGGIIASVVQSGNVLVYDYSPQDQRSPGDEPYDRTKLKASLQAR